MDSQTPSPQDPSRFSKPKSEPPILDLDAKSSESKTTQPSEQQRTEMPKHDKIELKKTTSGQFSFQGIIGGVMSGGVIALAMLGYVAWQNHSDKNFAKYEAALSTKSDQSQVDAAMQRLDAIEANIAEFQSVIASIAKQSSAPDATFIKRLDSLKAELDALAGRETSTASTSRNPVRLSIALSIRDLITGDRNFAKEISTLEALGESSTSFIALKPMASTPLVSYAALSAMTDKIKAPKTAPAPADAETPADEQNSQITNLIGRLVTVRPADKPDEKLAPNTSVKPIVDALLNRRASDALNLIRALPEADRVALKPVETEVARRAAAERAINALIDDLLDRIAKESKP